MVKISSQTVLALLRYRYLHKSWENAFCPRGESMGVIMRDFDQIRILDGSRNLRIRIKNNERLKIRHKTSSFWRPKWGTLISHLTMKKEIPFYPLLRWGTVYRSKYEWPPGASIMKNSTYKLKIIVWHGRKNASFHSALNMLFQCNNLNVHETRNSTSF